MVFMAQAVYWTYEWMHLLLYLNIALLAYRDIVRSMVAHMPGIFDLTGVYIIYLASGHR